MKPGFPFRPFEMRLLPSVSVAGALARPLRGLARAGAAIAAAALLGAAGWTLLSLGGLARGGPAAGGLDPGEDPRRPEAVVKACDDFELTGEGTQAAWAKAEWVPLAKRHGGAHPYDARFKTLHSRKGIYFLMEGTDAELTATLKEDYLDLWTEDVFEVFLWTDERHPIYFEYEVSPLGRELPILVPNVDGKFLGWRPWHYEGERVTRKATSAIGGKKEGGARVEGWRAEVFLPYELLRPLGNVPPRPGTRWRANVYRVDHDGGKRTGWHWAPVGPSFHEFEKFGTLVFE